MSRIATARSTQSNARSTQKKDIEPAQDTLDGTPDFEEIDKLAELAVGAAEIKK